MRAPRVKTICPSHHTCLPLVFTTHYSYELESGGLNEALSDIIAVSVADWAQKQKRRTRGLDWYLFRQSYPLKCDPKFAFLRSLQNPEADNFEDDNGNVIGSYNCWDARFAAPYDSSTGEGDGVDVCVGVCVAMKPGANEL